MKDFFAKLCEPWINASCYERARWLVLVVIFASVCVAAQYCFYKFWNIGIDTQRYKCIDHTVYIISKTDRYPVRDQIFAVESLGAEPAIPDGSLMAKYIRGMPGDTVTITTDQKILINGKQVGEGLYHLKGASPEVLKKFIGSRVLQADEYWVMGTLPRSFDSRYYGPVSSRQIKGRVYAAF